MPGVQRPVDEHEVVAVDAEAAVDGRTDLDGPGADDRVGAAGEDVDAVAPQAAEVVDPAALGEVRDPRPIRVDALQPLGRLHALEDGLRGQRDDALAGHREHGAAVEPAGHEARAHDLGRVRDVQLVGHEGAGGDAGDGHPTGVDGVAAEFFRRARGADEGGAGGERAQEARPCQSSAGGEDHVDLRQFVDDPGSLRPLWL
jgi:hypothetical protein